MSELQTIKGIKEKVLLSDHSTFGMGGEADFFYEMTDFSILPALIDICSKEKIPYFTIGWGSNIIFSENGFRGLIIKLSAKKIFLENDFVVAEAGALLSQVIVFCLNNGFIGMEKMIGIPGTIGGAIRGNAGAYGSEIKDYFHEARVFLEGTGFKKWNKKQMNFVYRGSEIKKNGGIIEKIWLKLLKGDTVQSRKEIKETLSSRIGKHPYGLSCGSFFKNPSKNSQGIGMSAGMLIEQAGMKGAKIGGAFVSEKHANFIMSDGSATMKDLCQLVQKIQNAVMAKFAILLEPEVQLMDEYGKINLFSSRLL